MTVQLKLGADGDLALELGNLVLVDDVAQRIRTRLRMLLGEWFLSTTEGTPYLQQILVKNPNLAHVRSTLRRRILDTEGVRSIAHLDLDFDVVRRKLTVDARVVVADGSLLGVQL